MVKLFVPNRKSCDQNDLVPLTQAKKYCPEIVVDYLAGLKENVIVGKLIPAGTGLKRYKAIKLTGDGQEAAAREGSEEVIVETREGFGNER